MSDTAKSVNDEELRRIASELRARIIANSHKTHTPHLGSCLSCVDILVAAYFRVLNIDPKRPELFLYLGTAYFRAKEYERAVQTLQEGLTLDDKQKDLHFQLGVVYEKQEKFDEAVRQFKQVITIDPKHAEAYNYVGYMYAEKGQNLEEAVRLIGTALSLTFPGRAT